MLMAGQDVPRLFCSDADRDGDFDGAVADPQVVAQAWAAFGRRWISPRGLCPRRPVSTSPPTIPQSAWQRRRSDVAARGLVGMIEEYAGTWVTLNCCASAQTTLPAAINTGYNGAV